MKSIKEKRIRMNRALAIFEDGSIEKNRLQSTAYMIEAETGKKCFVKDILFNAVQDWMYYTTISMYDEKLDMQVQLLSPKEQELIIYGTMKEWFEIVTELIKRHK